MKKIILMLILLPNIVFANVVYTEYEEFIMGTNKYFEESDTLKREEYKLYKEYRDEKEELYAPINSLDKTYQIDLEDYYFQEEKSLEYSEYAYDYNTKCFNDQKTIQEIEITDFSENINLGEIKVTSIQQVGLRTGIYSFIGDNPYIVFDGKLYDEYVILKKDSSISIGFLTPIDLSNITIKLYLKNKNDKPISFQIKLNYSPKLYGVFELHEENNIINISFDNLYNEFINKNNFFTNNNCISYYNVNTPYYKYTKYNKIPLDTYIPFKTTNKLILSDYKTFYNYYKREKIEFVDNIILENNNFNINNYIKTSTIPIENLNVITNIDYQKSGIYTLKIYYKEKILAEKNIDYKTDRKEKEENIVKTTTIKTTTSKKVNATIKKKKTTKFSKQTTKEKLTLPNLLNKKNNSKQKDNKKLLIIIITTLIILLTIFEIILLYVNQKYF